MSRNSNQLSVAELLARNGQQPASSGGRRRRGGRGLSVDDLSGDIPAVERNGSAHAAPDEADAAYAAEDPAAYAAEAGDPAGNDFGVPGGSDYGAQSYAGEQVSYAAPDPNNSPMSGPITVYNPLEPYQAGPAGAGAPARLGDPDSFADGRDQLPPAEESRRSGRRRRPDPDDDLAAEADYANETPDPSWETDPATPGGGRAARRRAAEAAEAAAVADSVPEPEAAADYGLPAGPADFGRTPLPSGIPDFGGPDAGPSWPGQGFDGPPRLGPPDAAPPTEAWQTHPDDSRPKLERRRRGERPLPEPASWQESPEAGNGDQHTVAWSPTDQGMRLHAGLQGLEPPQHETPDHGEFRAPGPRNGRPVPPAPGMPALDFGPDQGFHPDQRFGPDPGFGQDPGFGPGPDFGPDPGFAKTDIFATDAHGPMRPHPHPVPPGEQFETGDFEPEYDPDADDYDHPEDTPDDENRLGRARSALSDRFGAAGGKFAATKARLGAAARTPDRETTDDPRKQWMILGAQSVGSAIAGMLAFKGFEMLWEAQPLAALALAVVVILGLVALVRILRRGDDMFSTVIAVVVGVFVTLGPLAFLLSTG
ncbi:hypothetical protein [Nocardia sp. NBC_01329]|uniref:hypothetical protein n=1 Tax=Nocardia sp. NBC_01329 TaxID=2903594 RepID=UPI002E12D052|nr:hypothetical protein OG405_28225 [Nocardia sp. NBC_01329]